jgi:hypothetical protein
MTEPTTTAGRDLRDFLLTDACVGDWGQEITTIEQEAREDERRVIAAKIAEMTDIAGEGMWDSTYSAEPGVNVKELTEWLLR